MKTWFENFREQMRVAFFPVARNRPPDGSEVSRVGMVLRISRDGSLLKLVISESSGSPDFDARSLAAVRATAPFSPFPAAYDDPVVHIDFTYEATNSEEATRRSEQRNRNDGEWTRFNVDLCLDPDRTLEAARQLLPKPYDEVARQRAYLRLLLQARRMEQFGEYAEQVEKQFGTDREILQMRALWLYLQGKFTESQRVLLSLGEPKSEADQLLHSYGYYRLLGNLNYAQGDSVQAAKQWRRSAESMPKPDERRNLEKLAAAVEVDKPTPGYTEQRIQPECSDMFFSYPVGRRMQELYSRLGLPLK